jgi:hypothetical protein
MNNLKIIELLKQSGWYEGRDMSSHIKNSSWISFLPKTVVDFYSSFMDLTICSQTKTECLTVDKVEILSNFQIANYYLELKEKLSNEIDTSNDDDGYYYSILLGTQIFSIGMLTDRNILYLDKYGNFYMHTHINTFHWIANSTENAFCYLFSGGGGSKILDESRLIWVQSKINPIDYIPPINEKLTENPWG